MTLRGGAGNSEEDYMDVVKLCRAKAQLKHNQVTAVKDNYIYFCRYISNKRRSKENLYPLLDIGKT